MILDVMRWWLQQTGALLPRAPRGAGDALIISQESAGLAMIRRRRGQERRLGPLPVHVAESVRARPLPRRGRKPVLLRSESRLLQRDVVLPLAAEAAPGQVLHYEMDRLTPFRIENVIWHWRLLRRDVVAGQLHLRLWVLPRVALQPALDMLGRLGLSPDAVEAATAGGDRCLLPLQQPSSGPRRQSRLAIAACAVLALMAVALPFLRQSLAAAAVERRIEALRPQVEEAAALRHNGRAGADLFAAERKRLGDPVTALAAVTEALPDGTYLTEFVLRHRTLHLAGQSRGAAALIPRLAAARHLRNPAFAAPVTRSDTGHADLFAIQAELVP